MALLCASLLAAGLSWTLPAGETTLVWTHSVEKIEWQETWAAEDGRLHLRRVRIKGSGAGMEPADNAVLEEGWWTWQPEPPVSVERLALARSGAVADWRFCFAGDCRPAEGWMPGLPPTGALTLAPC